MYPYKISVMVPIYKVELFLERCVRSLFEQTLDDVQYIFVDDCSPDQSMDILISILKEYPQRAPHTTILHHKQNRGLSAARGTAMKVARGEYLYHCDSDDWAESTMLEKMYNRITEENADILIAGVIFENIKGACTKIIQKAPVFCTPHQVLSLVLKRKLVSFQPNKLIRHSLYTSNNIDFPDSIDYGEDGYAISRLLFYAQKVVFIPEAFYHYCYNPASITSHRFQRKHFDARFWWIRQLEILFYGNSALIDALTCMKLFVKQDAYRSGLYSQAEFDAIYPEAVMYINKVPLHVYDRFLLCMACNGKAERARYISESWYFQTAIRLLRSVKYFLLKFE